MMPVDRRKKNLNWYCADSDGCTTAEQADRAIQMDIRDALHELLALAQCYRIPLALDAMHEMGVDLRRKKRAAAAKRKSRK